MADYSRLSGYFFRNRSFKVLNVTGSTYRPALITASAAIEKSANNPLCVAATRIPNVPMTGMPSTAAARLAALSSKTATVPGFLRANSSTSVSPLPKRQVAIGDTTGFNSTTDNQAAFATAAIAGSPNGPALISSSTARGTTTGERIAGNKSK